MFIVCKYANWWHTEIGKSQHCNNYVSVLELADIFAHVSRLDEDKMIR